MLFRSVSIFILCRNLNPQIYRKGIPVVKDINETTASLSIGRAHVCRVQIAPADLGKCRIDINETTASLSVEYQIAALDENGNQEIYDVTEFYRMRYTETRIMLLDFKRSASQVFEESSISISDKGLLLGVRDKNVEYMMNEKAGVLAFVQKEIYGLILLMMENFPEFSVSAKKRMEISGIPDTSII